MSVVKVIPVRIVKYVGAGLDRFVCVVIFEKNGKLRWFRYVFDVVDGKFYIVGRKPVKAGSVSIIRKGVRIESVIDRFREDIRKQMMKQEGVIKRAILERVVKTLSRFSGVKEGKIMQVFNIEISDITLMNPQSTNWRLSGDKYTVGVKVPVMADVVLRGKGESRVVAIDSILQLVEGVGREQEAREVSVRPEYHISGVIVEFVVPVEIIGDTVKVDVRNIKTISSPLTTSQIVIPSGLVDEMKVIAGRMKPGKEITPLVHGFHSSEKMLAKDPTNMVLSYFKKRSEHELPVGLMHFVNFIPGERREIGEMKRAVMEDVRAVDAILKFLEVSRSRITGGRSLMDVIDFDGDPVYGMMIRVGILSGERDVLDQGFWRRVRKELSDILIELDMISSKLDELERRIVDKRIKTDREFMEFIEREVKPHLKHIMIIVVPEEGMKMRMKIGFRTRLFDENEFKQSSRAILTFLIKLSRIIKDKIRELKEGVRSGRLVEDIDISEEEVKRILESFVDKEKKLFDNTEVVSGILGNIRGFLGGFANSAVWNEMREAILKEIMKERGKEPYLSRVEVFGSKEEYERVMREIDRKIERVFWKLAMEELKDAVRNFKVVYGKKPEISLDEIRGKFFDFAVLGHFGVLNGSSISKFMKEVYKVLVRNKQEGWKLIRDFVEYGIIQNSLKERFSGESMRQIIANRAKLIDEILKLVSEKKGEVGRDELIAIVERIAGEGTWKRETSLGEVALRQVIETGVKNIRGEVNVKEVVDEVIENNRNLVDRILSRIPSKLSPNNLKDFIMETREFRELMKVATSYVMKKSEIRDEMDLIRAIRGDNDL